MNNTNININDLIQNEVNRISLKYGKDFLTTKVGKRQVVSVFNFVTWLTINNNKSEVQNG